MASELELSVSDFVSIFNQTLEIAYPSVVISGELANFRVSKNRWVYFDLKDEYSSLKFFGTVYQLPGPLENGLLLKVRAQPKLHNTYGFNLNVLNIQLAGEGSIRRAANLLKTKLESEGLFDPSRKRQLPYPPSHIGLITSKQSAAYSDFTKILHARWRGIRIELIDVQVQGEVAPSQIVAAIDHFSSQAELPDAVIIIRGGGDAEDLAAFSSEQVTRAVAASRAPTLVAIGHEIDVSLAELAADLRASTPSNAAELLVPDRLQSLAELQTVSKQLERIAYEQLKAARADLNHYSLELQKSLKSHFVQARSRLAGYQAVLEAYNPQAVLQRGYAVVHDRSGSILRGTKSLKLGDIVDVRLSKGRFGAVVKEKEDGNGK